MLVSKGTTVESNMKHLFLKNIAEFEQFTARVSEFFLLTH